MPKKPINRENPLNSALPTEEAILGDTASFKSLEPEIAVFRPDREGIRKVLGDLEADIMEYIWEQTAKTGKGILVREVYEAFRLRRSIAYTTVMSTMARLARKHLLRVEKIEAAYLYTPILSKDEFIDNFVSRILENLLVSFAHTTEAQLERLSAVDNSHQLETLKARVANRRKALKAVNLQETSSKDTNQRQK